MGSIPFPIERYKREANLGSGAQGIVSIYEIKDGLRFLYLPKKVAVKSVPASDSSREVKMMLKIAVNNHANIIKCYGHCELQSRRIGIVMEPFDSDLMQYLTSSCTVNEAKHILKQLAEGLKHLKVLDIIHRDIKPENVLVRKGESGRIHISLTDLGVSKHLSRTQQSDQTNTGTDLWMAPEIREPGDPQRSTYGHPADVYGFGLVAVYLLTLEYPMGRQVQAQELTRWLNQHLEDVSLSDQKFQTLIVGCLKFNPAERIPKEDLANPEFYCDEELITVRKQLAETENTVAEEKEAAIRQRRKDRDELQELKLILKDIQEKAKKFEESEQEGATRKTYSREDDTEEKRNELQRRLAEVYVHALNEVQEKSKKEYEAKLEVVIKKQKTPWIAQFMIAILLGLIFCLFNYIGHLAERIKMCRN